jgi:hypothetical protein
MTIRSGSPHENFLETELVYLSPCGRGRPAGAGEGYFRAAQVLKRFQKALRAHQTNAESRLWYSLRSQRFQGWKFRHQHILQGYIVDFVCLETEGEC